MRPKTLPKPWCGNGPALMMVHLLTPGTVLNSGLRETWSESSSVLSSGRARIPVELTSARVEKVNPADRAAISDPVAQGVRLMSICAFCLQGLARKTIFAHHGEPQSYLPN